MVWRGRRPSDVEHHLLALELGPVLLDHLLHERRVFGNDGLGILLDLLVEPGADLPDAVEGLGRTEKLNSIQGMP